MNAPTGLFTVLKLSRSRVRPGLMVGVSVDLPGAARPKAGPAARDVPSRHGARADRLHGPTGVAVGGGSSIGRVPGEAPPPAGIRTRRGIEYRGSPRVTVAGRDRWGGGYPPPRSLVGKPGRRPG